MCIRTEAPPLVQLESRDRATILVHFYRAMVGRADIWRMRMDATTNWAIGTTAAVVSFALGNAALPHYAVLLASLLTGCFLMLEARRLTFYHLFQQRVLLLERALVRPALHDGATIESDADVLAQLDPQLGATVPTMPILKAVARRLRRVYVYLFAAQWLAWMLKLSAHPEPATSVREAISRASMAGVPGPVCFAASIVALGAAVAVALTMGGVDRRKA